MQIQLCCGDFLFNKLLSVLPSLVSFILMIRKGTIYPTPPLGQDMTQGQFFKPSLTGFNSEFSFS